MAALEQQRFRQALAQRGRARCVSVRMIADPVVAHMAAAAGFEAIYVDLEHSLIAPADAASICRTAGALGMAALVRLPDASGHWVGQLLDAGVAGLIVTGVQTPEDLFPVVSACSFPPRGSRSVNWSTPDTGFRRPESTSDYLASRPSVVAMVETAQAVRNAADLAATDGVDMLFVGCADLSLAMGHGDRLDHPDVVAATLEVARACHAAGKEFGLGGTAAAPELAARILALGPAMLSGGTDQALLAAALYRQAQQLAALDSSQGEEK